MNVPNPGSQVWSSEKIQVYTLVQSMGSEFKEKNCGLAGSEFGERTWPNPSPEFGFGVRRTDWAQPWFGRFGERNGSNLSWAGSMFGERLWPNTDLEFGFRERNRPNPGSPVQSSENGSAGLEFREKIPVFG